MPNGFICRTVARPCTHDKLTNYMELVLYDAVNRNKVFNTLTRFYFPSHSLHVSAPAGHLQVRYTIMYF
jgi:hypothetical protein